LKEGDPTDRLAVDDAGARAQLCERVDNERKRYVSARSQSEYEASQAELRSAQEELQRVRSELKQATDQFRNEEAARMALETSNVELRYERERLNGIVTSQHNDLKKLAGANNLIKRRIRHAAIAASVMVVVGLTTWLSGAHALFLAAP
jgi:chromosome segregation ATPase